jgi:hypothetical protein
LVVAELEAQINEAKFGEGCSIFCIWINLNEIKQNLKSKLQKKLDEKQQS